MEVNHIHEYNLMEHTQTCVPIRSSCWLVQIQDFEEQIPLNSPEA